MIKHLLIPPIHGVKTPFHEITGRIPFGNRTLQQLFRGQPTPFVPDDIVVEPGASLVQDGVNTSRQPQPTKGRKDGQIEALEDTRDELAVGFRRMRVGVVAEESQPAP